MSRERRTAPGQRRTAEWGIVVVLTSGNGGFYYLDERHRDANGEPLERWGRESQALRFATQAEARRMVAGFQRSPSVRNHISNIFSKLQVVDRAAAIVRAREAGLGTRG